MFFSEQVEKIIVTKYHFFYLFQLYFDLEFREAEQKDYPTKIDGDLMLTKVRFFYKIDSLNWLRLIWVSLDSDSHQLELFQYVD